MAAFVPADPGEPDAGPPVVPRALSASAAREAAYTGAAKSRGVARERRWTTEHP
jgi:hypothetical protein